MGPYVFLNAALVGAAISMAAHYFILWWWSRAERGLLLFSVHNVLLALYGSTMVGLAGAASVSRAQAMLDLRTSAGLLGMITGTWVASSFSGLPARRFLVPLTLALFTAVVLNGFVPIVGEVTEIESIRLAWGERYSFVRHTVEPWLMGPGYALVFVAQVFSCLCGVWLWRRDRVGGSVLAVASLLNLVLSMLEGLRDLQMWRFPYPGAPFYVLWGLLISTQIGRRHRQGSEALRESEARLRALNANLPNSATYQLLRERDGSERFIFVSPSVERLHGLSADAVLQDASLLYDQIIEEDRIALRRAEAASLRTMGVVEEEVRYRPRGGEIRWARLSSMPRALPDGRTLWDGIETDVTDRHRAEQALRESEERNRLITHEVKDHAIFMLDPSGKVMTWNAGAQRVSGYSGEEILGKPNSVFFLPEEVRAGKPEQDRERARTEGTYSGAGWRLRKDGTRAWMEGSLTALYRPDRTLLGYAVVARDRTEIKRSEAMWHSVVDTTIEGVITLDDRGHIDFVNAAAAAMFGYSPEDFAGRPVTQILPSIDAGAFEREHDLPDRLNAGDRELDGIRKGGQRFPVELGVSAWSFDGRRYHTLLIRDLSQRRSLEQQLRQAQKMEALGRLAGGVAHDFNNLLTVIAGYSHLLLAGAPDDKARSGLEQIRDAGERASALTRQLLAFSRQSVQELKLLDLNDVIRNAEGMLRRLIGEDVELCVELAPAACWVQADPDQLGQVLLNLAVNSRDAMPQGGKLTITSSLTHAQRGCGDAGTCATLSVQDAGTGMSPEVKARVFEPFFTTKAPGAGTGLGLAVVHGIIEQSKGTIEVDSELGRGTTFRIHLPLADPTIRVSERHDSIPVRGPPGNETVMLVEDDPSVRALLQRSLEHSGFRVLAAVNGAHAVRLLEQRGGAVDVLLTDVVMPGMSGRELADVVRQKYPGLPVLFTSGYTDDTVLRHGLSDGEFNLLRKPFTPDALATKLRLVLNSARAKERPATGVVATSRC